MRLLSVLLSSLFVAMFAGPTMSWPEKDVARDGLHGSLIASEGAAARAIVLILAGSGPVDRDGNLPGMRNDSLKLLAQGLADNGIASLRIDKRGVGQSARQARMKATHFHVCRRCCRLDGISARASR